MNENDLKKQLAEAQKEVVILHEELNRTNSELLQLTLNLEDRVAERTRELSISNSTLETEIEERKKTEEELRRYKEHLEELVETKVHELLALEERFETIVQTIPDIVYRIDTEGRFVYLNNAIERLGYEPKYLIGRHFSEVLLPVDLESASRSHVLPRLRGSSTGDKGSPRLFDERRTGERKTTGLEVRLILKSGEIKPGLVEQIGEETVCVEINSSGMYETTPGTETRIFIGTVGVLRDITERKEAEESLKQQSEIVRNMEEGVYLVRASDGIIVFANPKFERMFGYAPGEMTGRHVSIVNAPSDKTPEETAREIIEALNRTGAWSGEVHNLKKDGTPFWCHATVSTFNHHRYGTVWVSIHQDISERKRAEEEIFKLNENLQSHANKLEDAYERLKDVDRLKNMFISTMSHELRTPLNSIIGFSSIMLDEWIGPLNEEQKKNLATVHRSGQHLLALINDVIDISRIEAGTVTTNLDEFDLHDVISEAVNSLLPQIKDKGLEIAVDTIHQPMRNDRRRLLQSLLNLMSNAVKFTERGRIGVTARIQEPEFRSQNSECIEIIVEDTGIGIKEEDISKLFQSFIRIDSPLRSKVGGTGLGLYLTKKLVTEVLKGEITVSSRYGEGSRFVMRIPAHLTPSPP